MNGVIKIESINKTLNFFITQSGQPIKNKAPERWHRGHDRVLLYRMKSAVSETTYLAIKYSGIVNCFQ